MTSAWKLGAVLLVSCLGWLGGCGEDSPPPRRPTKRKPAVTKPVELDEGHARALASRLANAAFLKERFTDPSGAEVAVKANFKPSSWQTVSNETGRWVLNCEPPVGATASVSFDLDGSSPRVYVGFNFP